MNLYHKVKLTYAFVCVVGRFFGGRPLDGKQRTNSRFWVEGTRALTRDGYASRWAMQAGWFRLLVRLSVLVSPVAIPMGYALYPTYTVAVSVALSGLLAYVLGKRAYRVVRYPLHYRRYVRPSAKVLRPALGYPSNHPARLFLDVPRDYGTRVDAKVILRLPAEKDYPMERRQGIEQIVSTKLAMPDMSADWQLVGAEPTVLFRTTPRPPISVLFADVREHMEALPEGTLFLGLGRQGKHVTHSLEDEDPHALISMRTGGGKSVTAQLLASQVLRTGGRAIIVDFKRSSHPWARGLDDVLYVRDIHDIHEALCAVGALVIERNRELDDLPNVRHQRVIVILEELNATMSQLKQYWEMTRKKDDPKTSPAVIAFGQVLYMGRTAKINLIAIGQRLSAKALGDADFRDNFGLKIMARYSFQTWKMLCPEITKPPSVSFSKRGRQVIVKNGTAYETQGVYMTAAESQQWITERRLVPVSQPSLPAETPRHVLGQPLQSVTPGLVTLAEAAGDMMTALGTLRRESTRDPDFPKPKGKDGSANTYDLSELTRWERNRVNAKRASA